MIFLRLQDADLEATFRKISAVICHSGSQQSGHFRAMSLLQSVWYENNDDLPIIAGDPNATGLKIVVIFNHNILSCAIPMK